MTNPEEATMTTETTLSDDIRAVAEAMRSVFTRLNEEIGDRPTNSAERRIFDALTWGTLMEAARVAEEEPVGAAYTPEPEPKAEPKPVRTITAVPNATRDGWHVFEFVGPGEIVAEYDMVPGQRDWPEAPLAHDTIVRDAIWDMIHGQAQPNQPWRIVDDIENADLSHTIGEAVPA